MRATDTQGRTVELTKIVEDCGKKDCPAGHRSDRGTAGMQGYLLHADRVPPGKALVELPVDVLLEAARALCR